MIGISVVDNIIKVRESSWISNVGCEPLTSFRFWMRPYQRFAERRLLLIESRSCRSENGTVHPVSFLTTPAFRRLIAKSTEELESCQDVQHPAFLDEAHDSGLIFPSGLSSLWTPLSLLCWTSSAACRILVNLLKSVPYTSSF